MPQPVSSLHSESTDFDYSGMSSGPPVCSLLPLTQNKYTNLWQSPVVFAAPIDCQFSRGLDFGAALSDVLGGEAKVQKTSEPAIHSPISKIGVFFSVPPCAPTFSYWSDTTLQEMTRLLDRAIDRIRSPKP